MVISQVFETIKSILSARDIEDYEFDSLCIMEDYLHADRMAIAADGGREADDAAAKRAIAAAQKRAEGYPLQYVLGKWEFFGLPFRVGEGVLIPRPDTEILVETVLDYFNSIKCTSPKIVDLCSGSGCISVALKKHIPEADVTAVELSSEAMPYLVENARMNGVVLRYIKGDVMNGAVMENFADKEDVGEYIKADCIVSNPPYLTAEEMSDLQTEVGYEPKMALDGGLDGLKFYRVISCLWKTILKDGGLLAFEAGYMQGQAVKDIMEKNGFENVRIKKDYGGNDRVIYGFKKPDSEKE